MVEADEVAPEGQLGIGEDVAEVGDRDRLDARRLQHVGHLLGRAARRPGA
jgi:hypothetical protein